MYVISYLKFEDIPRILYEKKFQKTNQKEFMVEKVIKKNMINYMSNGKIM